MPVIHIVKAVLSDGLQIAAFPLKKDAMDYLKECHRQGFEAHYQSGNPTSREDICHLVNNVNNAAWGRLGGTLWEKPVATQKASSQEALLSDCI